MAATSDSKLPVVDPTKNVLDLVHAESRYQDGMRVAEAKYQDAMRAADQRRIDDLAALRADYETRLELMRQKALENTSALLAAQLHETKGDLSKRMSEQEQFRWEILGRGLGATAAIAYVVAGLTTAAAIAATVVAILK